MVNLPLSIFLITKDEEDRLPTTLAAIKGWTDDIVVVDSGSKDQTLQIAKEFGARVFSKDWQGFGQQKRYGEAQCRYDWVLNLDADEVVTEGFMEEIKVFFEREYHLDFSLGKFKIVSVYPYQDKPRLWADYNYTVRFYNRQVAQFSDHPTWDSVLYDKSRRVYPFSTYIYHYSIRNFAHFIDKENRYTSLQVQSQKTKSFLVLCLRLFFEFPLSFFKAYFLRRHITGGLYGFCLSVFFANARFSRIAKMWEKVCFEKKKRESRAKKASEIPEK